MRERHCGKKEQFLRKGLGEIDFFLQINITILNTLILSILNRTIYKNIEIITYVTKYIFMALSFGSRIFEMCPP